MRLRTYYLAAFFAREPRRRAAGSDLAVFSQRRSRTERRCGSAARALAPGQAVAPPPLANTGIVYAQASAPSDAVATWPSPSSTSNRLLGAPPGTCGRMSTMPAVRRMKKAANDHEHDERPHRPGDRCGLRVHPTSAPSCRRVTAPGEGGRAAHRAVRQAASSASAATPWMRAQPASRSCSAPSPKDWKGMVPAPRDTARGPALASSCRVSACTTCGRGARRRHCGSRARQIHIAPSRRQLVGGAARTGARRGHRRPAISTRTLGRRDQCAAAEQRRARADSHASAAAPARASASRGHMAGYGNKKFRPMLLRPQHRSAAPPSRSLDAHGRASRWPSSLTRADPSSVCPHRGAGRSPRGRDRRH